MDDKWSLFQKFLITQDVEISLTDLVINSILVLVMSLFLEFTYVKCGRTFSNRKMFAQNFYIIAFTTMLIISIVKSSLALSLGLVGALSIVRFRAAIKEPEELSYLFLAIAIGLGLGANQHLIVPAAFAIIMLMVWIKHWFFTIKHQSQNLFLTVHFNANEAVNFGTVADKVKMVFRKVDLRRYDENKDGLEATFQVKSVEASDLDTCKQELEKLGAGLSMTYINIDA